jgi:hypothetical protein
MGGFVRRQLGLLNERPSALFAAVRPLARVRTLVGLQIALTGECLWAIFAFVRPFSSVRSNMDLQTAGVSETFTAEVADVFSFGLFVHLFHMELQVVFQSKSFVAIAALEGFLAVGFLVSVQRRRGRETFCAQWTFVITNAQVGALFVNGLRAILGERFVAIFAFVWAFAGVCPLVDL